MVTAMILGAGRGTRLRDLGLTTPKILVDIAGEPLLAHQLRYLEEQRVKRVVVNAHHLADQVLAFASAHQGRAELTVIVEPELLGTAGAVRNSLRELGADPFVVLYGDVVTEEPLAPLLAVHERSGAVATLAVYVADSTEGKGVVEVDADMRIRRFAEKAGSGPGLVNAGLYVLEPDFVSRIPPGTVLDFGIDVFPVAVARGERLVAYELTRPVLDIGTPAALAAARAGARHDVSRPSAAAGLPS
jgi:mannose-1-phosphate guanylyltransferase